MESLTKFDMRKNTDYAPSSSRLPKNTSSVSLNLDQSPHVAKKVLRMFKHKRKAPQYNG